MNMKRQLLIAILATGATVAHAQDHKPPAAIVEIGTATAAPLLAQRWVPGSVVSRDDSRIAGAASGRLESVVEVGARLKAGERVAKLDDRALKLRLEEIQAQVERAKAQLALSRTQLDRLKRLASSSSVAANQLDESKAQMEMYNHDLSRVQAQQHGIEHDIALTEIRAPFSGVVSERFVQRGEYVQTGTAIVHLVDTDRIEARVQAPLALAGQIHAGTEVALRSAGSETRAKVRAVVPVGDEKSRQFEMRIALTGGSALVGSAIEVGLPENPAEESLTIPRDALIQRTEGTFVMRINQKNTAEQIAVTAGASRGDRISVRGALAVGDRLVVRGAERLAVGQSVQVREPG
jgi:RND family efflux transporter MFP subunit